MDETPRSQAKPRRRKGLWDAERFPTEGWVCRAVRDQGHPTDVCDACGRPGLRYVHVLEHKEYHRPVHCGCVCAGRLEGDVGRARDRERRLRLATARRRNWLGLKGWRIAKGGGLWIERNGWYCAIYPRRDGWGAMARHLRFDYEWLAETGVADLGEAQLAAFDAVAMAEAMELHLHEPLRQSDLLRVTA